MLSSAQLRNKINQCLGSAKTTIPQALIIDTSSSDNSGRFLLPDLFNAGEDVITSLAKDLDGSEKDLQAGVRSANISVRYLTALQTIANVVAYNCEQAADTLCNCTTGNEVSAMFDRCFPEYNTTSSKGFQSVAIDFASQCGANYKGAIASLLSSLTFAGHP